MISLKKISYTIVIALFLCAAYDSLAWKPLPKFRKRFNFKCLLTATLKKCPTDAASYYYNLTSKRCHTGCTEEGDDFYFLSTCQNVCNVTEDLVDLTRIELFCEEAVPVVPCVFKERFHYDPTTKSCKRGCKRWDRDFRTSRQCEQLCKPAKTGLQVRRRQEYGVAKSPAYDGGAFGSAEWVNDLFQEQTFGNK